MLNIKTCPTCGKKGGRFIRCDLEREFKGRKYVVPGLEFHECPSCGERLYSPEAMRLIEKHSPAYRRKGSRQASRSGHVRRAQPATRETRAHPAGRP